MLSVQFFYGGWAVAALRIALGIIFIAHGWPKLKSFKGTAEWLGSAGFRPGPVFAVLVVALEFFGGIGLIVGFLTHIVAFFAALQFAAIIVWKIRQRQKFSGGWELDLLVLVVAAALFVLGAGAYSLDRVLFIGW